MSDREQLTPQDESRWLEVKRSREPAKWFLSVAILVLALAIVLLADAIREQTQVCYEPMQDQPQLE